MIRDAARTLRKDHTCKEGFMQAQKHEEGFTQALFACSKLSASVILPLYAAPPAVSFPPCCFFDSPRILIRDIKVHLDFAAENF